MNQAWVGGGVRYVRKALECLSSYRLSQIEILCMSSKAFAQEANHITSTPTVSGPLMGVNRPLEASCDVE